MAAVEPEGELDRDLTRWLPSLSLLGLLAPLPCGHFILQNPRTSCQGVPIFLLPLPPPAHFFVKFLCPERQDSQALVAHACNPSYSGARDQKDHSSKPAQANSSMSPHLKKHFTKMGLVERLKVKALSSIPSSTKKRRKEKKKGRVSFL
jgi:hypothetical protein